MAMRQCCDAYGMPKGVEEYTVMIFKGNVDPLGDAFKAAVSTKHGWLGVRGLKRAKGFMENSFTAVARTPADDTEQKAKADA